MPAQRVSSAKFQAIKFFFFFLALLEPFFRYLLPGIRTQPWAGKKKGGSIKSHKSLGEFITRVSRSWHRLNSIPFDRSRISLINLMAVNRSKDRKGLLIIDIKLGQMKEMNLLECKLLYWEIRFAHNPINVFNIPLWNENCASGSSNEDASPRRLCLLFQLICLIIYV